MHDGILAHMPGGGVAILPTLSTNVDGHSRMVWA
jgi:hypothetical protein